ncbi:hypothetical protein CUMW_100840 [Citrus unshiu]|nr:hypothetical protein CUMW_100840 [Citrus unshiu]
MSIGKQTSFPIVDAKIWSPLARPDWITNDCDDNDEKGCTPLALLFHVSRPFPCPLNVGDQGPQEAFNRRKWINVENRVLFSSLGHNETVAWV